ncbi:MAG: hypothetical protein OK454_04300, partial [Thaumarchaeota archaeon]|nr:hypothetical protein [Nitrososphaerota archaeon]
SPSMMGASTMTTPHTVVVPGPAPFAEGTVARITGAHKLIVEPSVENKDVKVGDVVEVVTANSEVMLGTVQERAASPYLSSWGIVVRGIKALDHCSVSVDGNQLQAVDSSGIGRTEVSVPSNGMVTFRIPDTLKVSTDSIVEVKNGSMTIARQSFSSIGPMTAVAPTH